MSATLLEEEDFVVEAIENIDNESQYDSETDLSCSVCKAEFLDLEDLRQHVTIHVQPDVVYSKTCDFCEKTVPDNEEYAKHIRDVHLSSAKFCQICSRVFTDFGEYQQHARKHNTTKADCHSCSQCPTFYSDILELERHEVEKHFDADDGVLLHDLFSYLSSVLNIKFSSFIKIKEDNADYICAMCEFKSNDMDIYIQHFQDNDCRSLTCDGCGNVYKQRRNIFSHLTRSFNCSHLSSNKTLQCAECLQFIKVRYFKNHVKNCKPIKCSTCDIVFDCLDSLTEHQTMKHPLSIEVKTCRFCLRQCVGKVALVKHMGRAHKGELDQYKYKCVVCEMIFKHPQKLFAHFFVKHKNLEPYMCQICDKTFKVRKKFTIHIKLQHDSVGYIEFDKNYHVYFTEDKPINPFIPTCVVSDEDRKLCNLYSEPNKSSKVTDYKSVLDAVPETDTESNPTEVEKEDPKPRKRRKTNGGPSKKSMKRSIVVKDSSDEDDLPLVGLSNMKQHEMIPKFPVTSKFKENRKKLTCKQCKKYCYTKQNYTRHIAFHSKKESKICIKCKQEFTSAAKLEEHVATKHKTSILTDTLKKLLEKKKMKETPNEPTMLDKFEQTIIKVPKETSAPAKIKALKGGTIVRRFIENFTPEDPKKNIVIESNISIKPISCRSHIAPRIKLTKYKPEPEYAEVKLTMPVKFKPDLGEKVKVKVQLINGPLKPSAFVPQEEKNEVDNDQGYMDDAYDDDKEYIPDVAQEEEVPVESSDGPRTIHVPHKIVIPKLPPNQEVSIAHLLPEAPYYKIVKINDVLNDVIPTPPKPPEEKRNQELIKLADGTKLVTVNPLAHLLGDKNVDEIMQPLKSKYYKPKVISDVENALTKALEKANMPTQSKKKGNSKDSKRKIK